MQRKLHCPGIRHQEVDVCDESTWSAVRHMSILCENRLYLKIMLKLPCYSVRDVFIVDVLEHAFNGVKLPFSGEKQSPHSKVELLFQSDYVVPIQDVVTF